MLSQRTILRAIVSLFALALVLTIVFAVISTSQARTVIENRDAQIMQLNQQLENLTKLVESLSGSDEYILVMRIDQEVLFGLATVHSTIIQMPVERSFYNCLCKGQDITDLPQVRLLGTSLISEAKIYVEDLYVIRH